MNAEARDEVCDAAIRAIDGLEGARGAIQAALHGEAPAGDERGRGEAGRRRRDEPRLLHL